MEPLLVYSNRTAWYPQGAAGDYATAVLRFDVPAGHMAVTGGTLRPAPHPGRTHAPRVPAGPARKVHHRRRRASGGGGHAPGSQAPRLLRSARAGADRPAPRRRRGDDHLLRGDLRPLPVSRAERGGDGGERPRRPQPTGHDRDGPAPPAAPEPAARRPRDLLGRARLLPRPRAGASMVGAGSRRTELPRALALGGDGAVRGGAVGAPPPRRRRCSGRSWSGWRAGRRAIRTRGRSTSATASATCRPIPRSTARWSTTRGRGSSTCCGRWWATMRSRAR